MNRLFVGALALTLGAVPVAAQSLEDLNIQIHGYATQGFLYTTNNNAFTTYSSNGSPAWSDIVLNVGAQPIPKLRVGVQARYFMLGNYGNAISLDWAAADYKVNEKFGARFGKVKTPSGLLNEAQDIDPSYIWCLVPQSIYPIASRNALLSHYGGVLYGTLSLGPKLGKMEYRGWGGVMSLGPTDGYLMPDAEKGIAAPNGLSGPLYGAGLKWRTPLAGLVVGAADNDYKDRTGNIIYTIATGTYYGHEVRTKFNSPDFYGQYDKSRFMVAAEFGRKPFTQIYTLTSGPAPLPKIANAGNDRIAYYGMASYKITGKLTGGLYSSQFFQRALALGPNRYSKDWALAGRYDLNQYLYVKFEQHFIDGTAVGYDANFNPSGTQGIPKLLPTTRLTLMKIGVNF